MRKKVKMSRQTTCYVIAYDIPDDKTLGLGLMSGNLVVG